MSEAPRPQPGEPGEPGEAGEAGESAEAAVVERVPARAALAGNPSDGYGGAVLAIPVDAYQATTTVRPADTWSIGDDVSGVAEFDDLDDVTRTADAADADAPHGLVIATLAAFGATTGQRLTPRSIRVSSSIPVSVGMAGSSAIVIGALRGLFRSARLDVPDELRLARWALHVETQRLGITAGLQDRLVQSFGVPVLMVFDRSEDLDSTVASVTPTHPGSDVRLLVAHRSRLAEPSQIVHGDLQRRFVTGDVHVVDAMRQLRNHAIAAGAAYESGDVDELGRHMDATFDLRAQMIDLTPGHIEMVHAARGAGAHANYTGSGGAIIVLSPDAEIEGAARQALNRLGCQVVSVSPDVSTPSGTTSSESSASSG